RGVPAVRRSARTREAARRAPCRKVPCRRVLASSSRTGPGETRAMRAFGRVRERGFGIQAGVHYGVRFTEDNLRCRGLVRFSPERFEDPRKSYATPARQVTKTGPVPVE